ncbi:MAG: putative selenate reductase subunit YgfK [Defluviitaleaceae bacterium]|nr:putative selenate reductase subunit YgfK [Defluviitaleaceae bacterium]
MSDKMRQIPFARLMNWVLEEYQDNNEIFGVRKFAPKRENEKLSLFNEQLEYPFGPAAGPHTQLAQNIIASYVAGGRFFELKTVQFLDGEDLPVSKPCILASDEGYNVEWSTELYVPQALEEYIKGWFALKLLSRELDLGDPNGFIFNMSVGYDLKGIRTEKINNFIDGLKNAGNTEAWANCKKWATENLSRFKNVDVEYIDSITPKICKSITLSTLHGCPPDEIERIATYLINEKNLNTFIKCNPTLLGYEYARETVDSLGFDYLVFDDHHFKADLQFDDAIPMFQRLKELATFNNLSFGVKLTNTFPVKITAGELPGQEMYMSGRSLYPLSIALANRLSKEFDGQLQISYSGGADIHNIAQLFEAGIWPITIATTLLKPGGYDRMCQIANRLSQVPYKPFSGVDLPKLQALADNIRGNNLYKKPIKPIPSHKIKGKVPLMDCNDAACRHGCPIGQDIPAYLRLAKEGKYLEALEVIIERNPLPFITGTLCPHPCTDKCTRGFYEEPVHIRATKKEVAEKAFKQLITKLKISSKPGDKVTVIGRGPEKSGGKIAIVGGGPAGLAAAYFLAKAGRPVTIFEKINSLGGTVRHVIPEFRISNKAIENDVDIVLAMGVEVCLSTEIKSLSELQDFETVIIAVGAWKLGELILEEGGGLNAHLFLEAAKFAPVMAGGHVIVIGGGNTAIDAARTAKRMRGVQTVSIVYRRTKQYMPASEEELQLAAKEGIKFYELLAPKAFNNIDGILSCVKMELGEPDASGRRSPVPTNEIVDIPAGMIISAIGDSIKSEYFKNLGIPLDENDKPIVNPETLESQLKNVYVIGDAVSGPATVVKAIKDAMTCAQAITGAKMDKYADLNVNPDTSAAINKKGILCSNAEELCNPDRCLECASVCENCADVCPNRANVVLIADGRRQVIHMDALCNECGNCEVFCSYTSAPYKDKFTCFSCEEDFTDSENQGFLLLKDGMVRLRLDGNVQDCKIEEADKLTQAALACDRLAFLAD